MGIFCVTERWGVSRVVCDLYSIEECGFNGLGVHIMCDQKYARYCVCRGDMLTLGFQPFKSALAILHPVWAHSFLDMAISQKIKVAHWTVSGCASPLCPLTPFRNFWLWPRFFAAPRSITQKGVHTISWQHRSANTGFRSILAKRTPFCAILWRSPNFCRSPEKIAMLQAPRFVRRLSYSGSENALDRILKIRVPPKSD